MVEVAFFVGAIGALGGAISVIALRNPRMIMAANFRPPRSVCRGAPPQ